MTIEEFLENPMGKGDASVNHRIIRDSMMAKYHRYDDKKGKKVEMHIYSVTLKKEYFVHLTMPSETERDNTYDVVFHFFTDNKALLSAPSIRNYDIQVFSNDPSFAYTFAYVYNKNGLMIQGLANKLGRRFLTDAPVVRNRSEIVNYDKYIFYAGNYLLDHKYLTTVYVSSHATTYSSRVLASRIRTLEKIMQEYQSAEAKLKKEKKYQETQEERTKGKKEPKAIKTSSPKDHKIPKVPKKKGIKPHKYVNKK